MPLADLDLRYNDGRTWTLLRPFPYFGRHWKGVVPKGFVTDFASIPRIFWRLLPPTGKYGKAAVVHDWLYRSGLASRKRADRTFLEAMERLGVGWTTRHVMYLAVRVFGRWAYSAG